ncbi:MAG: hypothetical protein EAS52_01195 [Parapedobacter sp.]|nr:MAG: hypothetical protein EAS52_01195 [Parapedobacter sp.]
MRFLISLIISSATITLFVAESAKGKKYIVLKCCWLIRRKKGGHRERTCPDRTQRLIEQERAKAYAEKLRSATKMMNSGFDNAMIADVLELPIEEVEKL